MWNYFLPGSLAADGLVESPADAYQDMCGSEDIGF
jgi:hypothetical protein